MAVNKKIKSFSPYRYNVQYATPGAGINQNKKQYIKSSPVNVEEYVVTRKPANFFTYVSSTVNYTLTDDCEIKFLNAKSIFTIRADKIIKDAFSISENELKLITKSVNVTNKNSYDGSFLTYNTFQITHSFYTMDIDCIVILNDEKYLNFKLKPINEITCQIILNEDINLSTSDFIKVILYPLGNSFNVIENNISQSIYKNEDLIYDNIKDIIAIDNKCGSSKIIPIVYDTNGCSYLLNGYDLNPSYVSFKRNNFLSKSQIINDNNNLNEALIKIRNENSNLTTDQLLSLNNEYKEIHNKILENEKIIEKLNLLNYEFDIEKIVLYKINKDSYFKILSYNINNDNITWSNENNNVGVIINHGLNGDVKVILDREDIYNYNIIKIDNNRIKINFGSENPKTCVLNIFKVK